VRYADVKILKDPEIFLKPLKGFDFVASKYVVLQ